MNDNTRIPQHELLINGKWVPPESGQYSTILNPATEEVIAHVAAGSEKDVDTAAKAARAALKVWNGISAAERGRILNRLADLLEQHQEELIALESTNAGKPIASVRRQDMPAAIDTLRYYAGWTDKIIGQVIPARTDALTYTVREPVGVVGAIVPWNFPLMIGIWKIAPALACGCTLIVKPAELTPMTAIRIGELALEAGIPPGVLNIVLNLTADNALEVSGTDVYMDFFTSYRDYRAESREQTLLYYDELLASDNLSAQAREEAEAARLQLMEDMETETALEGIIKGLGFEDAIVTSTTENINVIVKCAELTGTQATQIKEVVMTETGSTALNIRIIPTE